jgi:hypothetical protein
MPDQASSEAVATVARCPWCSADLPGDAGASCPACGAILSGEPERQLPGVTAIDADAIVRAARTPIPVRRNRLLSWISGDDSADFETPADPGSLAPPQPDVRREMIRIEIEAEVASMQADGEWVVADVRPGAEAADAVAADAPDVPPAAPASEPPEAGPA